VPNGKIVGLSKFGRLVNCFAHRLQVQERLTNQIADTIDEVLKPKGVGVVIRCEHFCMATRGVHMPGVFTTSNALRGSFLSDGVVRSEFLSLARQKG
jgi:GTP cyclohydrolase I